MPYISQVAVGRREHLNVFGNDYDTKDGTGRYICFFQTKYPKAKDFLFGKNKSLYFIENQRCVICASKEKSCENNGRFR